MALCTQIYVSGGRRYLIEDTSFDPTQCPGSVVLSSVEYVDWLAQLTVFGFDQQLFERAIGAGLLFFVTGLGVGLLISMIRKVRA